MQISPAAGSLFHEKSQPVETTANAPPMPALDCDREANVTASGGRGTRSPRRAHGPPRSPRRRPRWRTPIPSPAAFVRRPRLLGPADSQNTRPRPANAILNAPASTPGLGAGGLDRPGHVFTTRPNPPHAASRTPLASRRGLPPTPAAPANAWRSRPPRRPAHLPLDTIEGSQLYWRRSPLGMTRIC